MSSAEGVKIGKEGVIMVRSSSSADAALQDEGHCLARFGGLWTSKKVRQSCVIALMDGKVQIRAVMVPQAE